jgi:hypothetical protein
MRPLVIEVLDERVEAGLLLEDVARGRLGGFLLAASDASARAAILFRMSGTDPLDLDAEA